MIHFLRKFWGEEPHGLQAEHEREVFINLDLAYACPACRFIQERATQGVCRRCGARGVVTVDLALSNHLLARIAEAKARRTQQSRAQPTQEPQSLTDFRVKE